MMREVCCKYCGQELGVVPGPAKQSLRFTPVCSECYEVVGAAHRHWRLAKDPKRLEALIELIRRA